ncbi:MAG: hypothetical protein AB7J40_02605 [Candidatus Altimarinota bacterium]
MNAFKIIVEYLRKDDNDGSSCDKRNHLSPFPYAGEAEKIFKIFYGGQSGQKNEEKEECWIHMWSGCMERVKELTVKQYGTDWRNELKNGRFIGFSDILWIKKKVFATGQIFTFLTLSREKKFIPWHLPLMK